jgi:hypothetical protein
MFRKTDPIIKKQHEGKTVNFSREEGKKLTFFLRNEHNLGGKGRQKKDWSSLAPLPCCGLSLFLCPLCLLSVCSFWLVK